MVVGTAVVGVVLVEVVREVGVLDDVVASPPSSGRLVSDDDVVELCVVIVDGTVVDVAPNVVVVDAGAASTSSSGRAITTRTITTTRSTTSPAVAIAKRLTAPGYDSAPAFPGGQAAVDQINRPFQLVVGRDKGRDKTDHVGVWSTIDDHQLSFEGVLLDRLERFGIGGA